LPPYTYQAQFKALIRALSSAPTTAGSTDLHPIAFLTSTNTLGSSFWLNEGEHGTLVKALPSVYEADGDSCDGTGGLAGESLHPISLGE
jgi:dihydroorotate dehydrogenase (fumarate)